MTELSDIIDEAYHLFESYKVTIPLDVCTACCLTKEEERTLVNLPVQHIPFELLYDYNTAAKTVKPAIGQFKHFLPRILEITAGFEFLHHSKELVLSHFHHYDKSDWTKAEQALLQNFAQAYFSQCLSIYPLPDSDEIDSILIMLWDTKVEIELVLDKWTTARTTESLLHFNDLVIRGFKANKQDELSNFFAGKELSSIIFQWMNKQVTKQFFATKIENLILNPPASIEKLTLDELSWTYEKMTQ